MSRAYDSGKNAYGSEHRSYGGQQTRHIIANATLENYGANTSNYAQHAYDVNYRMGHRDVNTTDRLVDNAFNREVFGRGHYDAHRLANNAGISYAQQLGRIGNQFDVAKDMYARTGEYKYYMMQKDLRDVAANHLDADLRGFRLSNRN